MRGYLYCIIISRFLNYLELLETVRFQVIRDIYMKYLYELCELCEFRARNAAPGRSAFRSNKTGIREANTRQMEYAVRRDTFSTHVRYN